MQGGRQQVDEQITHLLWLVGGYVPDKRKTPKPHYLSVTGLAFQGPHQAQGPQEEEGQVSSEAAYRLPGGRSGRCVKGVSLLG